MDAAAYVLERQVLWARRHGIDLQGSAGERGRPAYTHTLEANLFEPLSDEARTEMEQGDGEETRSKAGNPPKILALHSSAAIAINVFHYWKRQNLFAPILRASKVPTLGAKSIRFEGKFPVAKDFRTGKRPPNIDVVVDYEGTPLKAVGVECKFREVFRKHPRKDALKPAYLNRPDLWTDLPASRKLAKEISPEDDRFEFLHAAQLLRHILGLKHAYGSEKFRLLYLWYHVPGRAGVRHEDELRQFAEVVVADGIRFQSITYQEIILSLARREREAHTDYVDYLAERYL